MSELLQEVINLCMEEKEWPNSEQQGRRNPGRNDFTKGKEEMQSADRPDYTPNRIKRKAVHRPKGNGNFHRHIGSGAPQLLSEERFPAGSEYMDMAESGRMANWP